MPSGGQGASQSEELAEAIFGVISESYYGERVRSGSNARLRAQAAQSTLTLFAGSLVAAFTFSSLENRGQTVQMVGVVAVVFWLLAAVLYMHAVAAPVRILAGPDRVNNRGDLVEAVLRRTSEEADRIDRRQRWANGSAILAISATAAAFGMAVLLGPSDEVTEGTVFINASFGPDLAKICGAPVRSIKGQVKKETIKDSFLAVRTIPGECGRVPVDVYIPKAAVRSMVLKKD